MDLDNGAAPDAENSNFADPEHLSTQLASLYRTEYQEISANTEHTMPEQTEPSEALLLLNDATYLHIQPCETGWDYTLYDKESMKNWTAASWMDRIWGVLKLSATSARTWAWIANPSSMPRCP